MGKFCVCELSQLYFDWNLPLVYAENNRAFLFCYGREEQLRFDLHNFWNDGGYYEGLLTNLPRLHPLALLYEILCKDKTLLHKLFIKRNHFQSMDTSFWFLLATQRFYYFFGNRINE